MKGGKRDPETGMLFGLGITKDGRVLVDFGTASVDHLMLTPEQAENLAQGLEETAREARQGIVRLPDVGPMTTRSRPG